MCLLTRVAGSGKSAITHLNAQLYEGQKRLGSLYSFSSANITRQNPQSLFAMIACNLTDLDHQFKSALCEIVKNNQELHTSQAPLDQVKHLIIESSVHLHAMEPLVIVINVLDESRNAGDH